MTALAGQVSIMATLIRERLDRALEAKLDPEVRETLEKAKGEANALLEAARRSVVDRDA